MKTNFNNWYVKDHKLKVPFNFSVVEYGYWSRIKTKRILKRCTCKLVNIPRVKREAVKINHVSLWEM